MKTLSALVLRLSILSLLAAGLAHAAPSGPGPGGATLSTTTTGSLVTQIQAITQRVDRFETHIQGHLQGSNALLFDQVFGVAVGDPTVSSAIMAARSILAANGATSSSGPSLRSSALALQGSQLVAVHTDTPGRQFQTFTNTIGPAEILIGDGDLHCAGFTEDSAHPGTGTAFGCNPSLFTHFTVAAGNINIDAHTHLVTNRLVTNTTTETWLTTQFYEVLGLQSANSVPEPGTLVLVAAALAALAMLGRRSRKGR